jgi:hypothetical protein
MRHWDRIAWVSLSSVIAGCLSGGELRPPVFQASDAAVQTPDATVAALRATDATVPATDATVPATDATVPATDATVPATDATVLPSKEPLSGRFADLSTELASAAPFAVAGLDSPTGPEATLGTIADLDGDGRAEVLLAVSPVPGAGVAPRGASVWRFDAATGALRPYAGITAPAGWTVVGAVDLDGDGAVDLVGTDRARTVAWGDGRSGFAVPGPLEARRPNDVGWGAYALDDLDDDGWLDVLAVHDDCVPGVVAPTCCEHCASLVPMLRTGARTFEAHSELIPQPPRMAGIAAQVTRAGNGERVLLAVAWNRRDAFTQVFFRRTATGLLGYPQWTAFDPFPLGNAALEGREAPDPMASIAAWSPMGAATADVDNDGLQDLVLALEPRLALLAGTGSWPLRDLTATAGLADRRRLPAGSPYEIPWAVAFVDLDRDGSQDLVVANGLDPSASTSSTRAIHHVTAYLNDGHGGFALAPDALGMGRAGQWRTLTVGDLDGDAAADVVVGGLGELPRVYRNGLRGAGRTLALRLRGTTSNHLGVGARVEVWPAGAATPQRFVVGAPAGPLVVTEPTVFVGLGAATTARARITWTSGIVQEIADLAAGETRTLTEPEVLRVDPPGRHVVGFGAEATITVTPRDAAGRPRRGATVTATAWPRLGTSVRVSAAGEGYTARVTGLRGTSAAVEVQIDGVPLGVRPRVWFD